MKAYQHELAHHYQQRKNVFRFASASLFQSLITAAVIGIVVAFIGVALNAVRWQGNTSWYVSATTGAVVEMVVVTALVTMVIEGRRKRAIRRTLELAFLNHHIRNAITQMSMAEYVADPQPHERLVREAVVPLWISAVLRHTRSEEHTSELQSHSEFVCLPLLEKKKRSSA